MKRIFSVLLVFLLLLGAASCREQEDGGTVPPTATPTELELPTDVNYISIYSLDDADSGSAAFDKTCYGVLLQILDELQATNILPFTGGSYDESTSLEMNVYGADGTLLQIGVDKNDVFWIGAGYYRISEGPLSYTHLRSYYDSFKE
jgi:hypothetical protein